MSRPAPVPSVRLRFPGRNARDPRYSVTLEEPGVESPVTVHFLLVGHDNGARAWINVGLEIGERFERPHGKPPVLDSLPRPVDPATVLHVAERFRDYVSFARGHLEYRGAPDHAKPPARKQRRRRMTDDDLRSIAAQYEAFAQHSGRPITDLAAAHDVNPSTASRWVAKARRLLDE